MSLSFVSNQIVVEFPDNVYVLRSNKSPESDYEYITLASSHKQTASYLFRWFRNMQSSCTKDNSTEKLLAMMNVFEMYRDDLFVSLREYVLIDGIVLTSYRLRVENSHLMCEVMNLMYRCWSSFGPLHFKAILGRRYTIRGVKSTDFLSFFLEHARRKKLQFNGIRMIDVSIYSCISKAAIFLAADVWSWKQMLVYLQYGAKFENLHQDPSKSQYGISHALIETLRTLIRHLWFRLVHPALSLNQNHKDEVAEYCSNLDADVKNLCRTFSILLRAIRRIPHRCLENIIRDTDDNNTIFLVPSRDVTTHCTFETMMPKFWTRYESPEELKHSCRWTIRKRLNENWQLPHGIRNLPVPVKLQRYLNLLED